MERAREKLGKHDFDYIRVFPDLNQLLLNMQVLEEKHRGSDVALTLSQLRVHLDDLKYFTAWISDKVNSEIINTSCVWGATSLLISVSRTDISEMYDLLTTLQLASESETATEKISRYLMFLFSRLQVIKTYLAKPTSNQADFFDFFYILIRFMLHCALAIKHFRNHDMTVALLPHKWKSIETRFDDFIVAIGERLNHLKELAASEQLTPAQRQHIDIEERQARLHLSNPQAARRIAQLPRHILPIKNIKFSGRKDVLERMDLMLTHAQEGSEINSVALWGTGGIGKSQVALEFAHRRIRQGCPLVIWIPSENENEVSTMLAKAASEVRPSGFNANSTPAEKRQVLQDWLQTTELGMFRLWLV